MIPDIGDWEERRKNLLEERISKSIHVRSSRNREESEKQRPSFRISHILTAFLLLVSVAVALTKLEILPLENAESTQQENSDHFITKSTPSGQKSKVHLSDGSIVTLNAATEIKYKEGFGTTHRDIYLSGEAFFEIAKRDSLSFNVFVDDIVTTAVGTSFNINSYDRNSVVVQLATGKVNVSSASTKNSLPLVPGEQVLFSNQQLLKTNFDLKKSFLWKDGILLFEKTPLTQVIRELERWYGTDIHLSGLSGKDPLISGRFENDYLTNVLETISFSIPLTYRIEEKNIYVHLQHR